MTWHEQARSGASEPGHRAPSPTGAPIRRAREPNPLSVYLMDEPFVRAGPVPECAQRLYRYHGSVQCTLYYSVHADHCQPS